MIAHASRSRWIGRIALAVSLCLLTYWSAFAIVAPVTVWDAHVYNLGRLPLAELGGLWSNPLWTSERQVFFPLAFDAIHLPLLHIGFGFSLPSFACFIGVLSVTWSALRRWHGPDAAWLGVLSLLALPTLVFQAVATKNDMAVLFGLAVWFHAMRQWKLMPVTRHLVFAALAIGFMAGAKSSGLPPSVLCSLASLWMLRSHWKPIRIFLLSLVVSLVTFGSVETYIIAYRTYGHLFGPADFVRDHRNNDGLKGAAANTIRYTAANLSTGTEPWLKTDPSTHWMEQRCRDLFRIAGLVNSGYRSDRDDSRLNFASKGWDSHSNFGPIGTLGLGIALLALIWWRPLETWWRLTVVAGALMGVVAYSVAWMPWNNRFLLAPFSLLAIATVCLAWRTGWRQLRWVILWISIYSVIVYPLTSFNKHPSDLVGAIIQREQQEFKERATMLPVVASVRMWRKEHPEGEILLLAGSDSWVLPFLTQKDILVRPTSKTHLALDLAANLAANRPTAVLALNRSDFRHIEFPLRLLENFPSESGTTLYGLNGSDAGVPRVAWDAGHYDDGWTSPQAVLTVENWPSNVISLEFWNPTPLIRTVEFSSLAEPNPKQVELVPGARHSIPIRVALADYINIRVTPSYNTDNPSDPRQLGVRLSIMQPDSPP